MSFSKPDDHCQFSIVRRGASTWRDKRIGAAKETVQNSTFLIPAPPRHSCTTPSFLHHPVIPAKETVQETNICHS